MITADLVKARRELFGLLGITEGYEDPAVAEFGLRNIVVTLQDTYIEVLTPVRPSAAASRFLERHGGDGGYMLMVQTDDLTVMSSHVEKLGIRKTWEKHLPNARVFHMHPKDTGGAILSFDEMVPSESWAWAGPGWEQRSAKHVRAISAVDVLTPEPTSLARRWEQLFGRDALSVDQGWDLPLDQGVIRIRRSSPGSTQGIAVIEVEPRDLGAVFAAARKYNLPADRNGITVCGVQFRFRG